MEKKKKKKRSGENRKPKSIRATIAWCLRWLVRLFVPNFNSDWIISVCTLILLGFGSVMLASIYQASFLEDYTMSLRPLIMGTLKQLLFVFAGWIVYSYMSYKPAVNLLKKTGVFLLFCAGYIAVMLYTALRGVDLGGARAWLRIFGITFQPSEFGKPVMILVTAVTAGSAARKSRDNPDENGFFKIFALPITLYLANIAFLAMQKDIGSLIIFAGIGLVCLTVPALRAARKAQRNLLLAAGACIALVVGVVYGTDWVENGLRNVPFISHISARIENMKNPYVDIDNEGYQPTSALYGMADGGLQGKGFGGSVRKYGFLTQSESDYIIAVVIEEFGLIGFLLISALQITIFWRLMVHARSTRLMRNRVLYAGTGAYLMLHYFINIGGVSMLIPMTGVPLLLISAGGTSVLAFLFTLGVCQGCIANEKQQEKTGSSASQKPLRAAGGNA